MRVALLTNFIAPYRLPLLEALRDRVGELRIFVSTPMESDRDWAVDWGSLDVVVQRNLTLHRSFRDPLGYRRGLQIHVPYDTLAQLHRYRPEVVISGELGPRSLQAALHRTLHPATRLLIWATLSEHTERLWGKGRLLARHAILGRADGVLVNGESGARYIRRFGLPEERIFRINQPVDVDLFTAARHRPPPAGTIRILYAGQLVDRKGVMPFAAQLGRWAAAHPERALEIWWLGDGPLRERLAQVAWPANLASRLCGAVPYGELPGYFAQCSLLVLPSLADEWGLVVNEAMAAGMPVLGSILSQAVEELVREGRTGWTFDPTDAASLAAALERCLGTPPAQIEAMGEAARQVIRRLTPTAAALRIAAAICRLTESPRRTTRPDVQPGGVRS